MNLGHGEAGRGAERGGRGKPPRAGAGRGGLTMETAFESTTGVTHRGPRAHVRATRATCPHTRTTEPTQSWLILEAT